MPCFALTVHFCTPMNAMPAALTLYTPPTPTHHAYFSYRPQISSMCASQVTKELSAYDSDSAACVKWLINHSAHCTGKVGIMGFCIGGHLAYRGALNKASQAAVLGEMTVCTFTRAMAPRLLHCRLPCSLSHSQHGICNMKVACRATKVCPTHSTAT